MTKGAGTVSGTECEHRYYDFSMNLEVEQPYRIQECSRCFHRVTALMSAPEIMLARDFVRPKEVDDNLIRDMANERISRDEVKAQRTALLAEQEREQRIKKGWERIQELLDENPGYRLALADDDWALVPIEQTREERLEEMRQSVKLMDRLGIPVDDSMEKAAVYLAERLNPKGVTL